MEKRIIEIKNEILKLKSQISSLEKELDGIKLKQASAFIESMFNEDETCISIPLDKQKMLYGSLGNYMPYGEKLYRFIPKTGFYCTYDDNQNLLISKAPFDFSKLFKN